MRFKPFAVCVSSVALLIVSVRAEDDLPDYYGHSDSNAAPSGKSHSPSKNAGKGSDDEGKPHKNRKEENPKSAIALKKRLKELNDPNPEIRISACDLLAFLGSPDSVLPLIEMLSPDRKEPDKVMRAANAALAKITNQNFGYREYVEWKKWWANNKEAFYKKAESGASPNDKIAAEASNVNGRELMKNGQYQQAQQYFLDAINRDPSVIDYHNNIGLCLLNLGKYLDAIVYFEETLALDPDCAEAQMNIGRCYSRMGKTIEAQAMYNKASKLDPKGILWGLKWTIGKEYMLRNEWKMAYEFVDSARVKAEKINIRDPRLYNDLAIIHYGMDQYHSAWKELANVRTLGFEPNKDFTAKVRKALVDQGIDPDAEDRKARENINAGNEDPDVNGDKNMPVDTSAPESNRKR